MTSIQQIENLTSKDPFAEADEDTGETKQSQNYIHIRIQRTSTPSFLVVQPLGRPCTPYRSLPF